MNYTEAFEELVKEQLARVEAMKVYTESIDYLKLDNIRIGIIEGDGIGPVIVNESKRVLEHILKNEIESKKIELVEIKGLTIENRLKLNQAVPEYILKEVKNCDLLLKGPTMTPSQSDNFTNMASANVVLRKELDLYANVRPIQIPEQGIDWTFFRENTEGEYIVGSKGVEIGEDLVIDFKVTTTQGTRRIAKMAYEFARKNKKYSMSVVTKANVIKKTDGRFLDICHEVAEDYPEIETEDWYIDIMTANLVNEARRAQFQVFVMPNLYGDILTDEAAQLQGGVGTAGSANIGSRYAMFEAIHGSAPRMVEMGRAKYANPSSILKAVVLMLNHIGMNEKASRLDRAIELSMSDPAIMMTGRDGGTTAGELVDYIIKQY